MRRDKHDRRSRQDHAESQQLKLFRALPGHLAPRDAQDLMAYPFFSLAKSKRLAPIDFRAGAVSIRVEATPEHGMATIWDADVLIWAASQIVNARDAGFSTSRLMASAIRDPDLRRAWDQRTRLPAPQGRSRPAPGDHGRDLDPAIDGTPQASLLLD